MYIDFKKACYLLYSGYVIGIKTDTVYGLASLEKYELSLYHIKKRNLSKKIVTMINHYINTNDNKLSSLSHLYWPGSTTLIYNNDNKLESYRYCNNYNVNYLIAKLNDPLKVTSANISGQKEVLCDEEFFKMFPNIPLLKEIKQESLTGKSSKILLYNKNGVTKLR